jgi:metallophosphoesterase (TIGR00282 family)
MRILFLGDVVGPPGVTAVQRLLPALREREGLDLVVANAENASGGSGLTPRNFRQLRGAGVDLFTMGDHIYKKMDIAGLLEKEERICKLANYPAEAPGRVVARTVTAAGIPVAAFCVLGRTYMRPVDCPYKAADAVLASLAGQVKCIIVDIHAEATADKYLMAHYLKGRVTAVIGTHTHVQTADEQIMPGGTAFLCDAGMTGPYDSILGRRIDRVLHTAVTFIPTAFDVAEGDPRLAGAIIDVDDATGQATAIRRLMLRDETPPDPAANAAGS